MDSLTTSEVGLGSAALTTAIIAWLKNLGLAPSQRWILLWAMVIPIVVQVLLTLANVTPVTTQGIAAAILAGITSGLASGGLHDHASAAADSVSGMFAKSSYTNGLQAIQDAVARGDLTADQAKEDVAALEGFEKEEDVIAPPSPASTVGG